MLTVEWTTAVRFISELWCSSNKNKGISWRSFVSYCVMVVYGTRTAAGNMRSFFSIDNNIWLYSYDIERSLEHAFRPLHHDRCYNRIWNWCSGKTNKAGYVALLHIEMGPQSRWISWNVFVYKYIVWVQYALQALMFISIILLWRTLWNAVHWIFCQKNLKNILSLSIVFI